MEDLEIQMDEAQPETAVAVETPAPEPDIEIEVVDDVPKEQKPRPPKDPNWKPDLPTDDELKQYSEDVQKRIKRLTFQYHEEKRQREQVARERDELAKFGQVLTQQNAHLRKITVNGQKSTLKALTDKSAVDLAAAQSELRQAYELNDSAKIAEATARISSIAAQRSQLESVPEPNEQYIAPPPPAPPQPVDQVSERTQRWLAENPWFGGANSNPMSNYAMSVHEYLVSRGVQPDSEQYYASIDNAMRQKYPANFAPLETPESKTIAQPSKTAPKKTPSVVSPVNRISVANNGKRTVTLSETQVATAKMLGLTPKQYAEQLIEDQNA